MVESDVNFRDPTTGRLLWKTQPAQGRAVFDPGGQFILSATHKLWLLNPKDGSVFREFGDVRFRSAGEGLAIRPDGKRALVGQGNGFVSCVDLKDGRVLFETRIGSSPVEAVAYTPNGSQFVTWTESTGRRWLYQVWDAESGTLLRPLLGGAISSGVNPWINIHPLSGELVADMKPTKVWDVSGDQREKRVFTSDSNTRNIAFWKTDDLFFVSDLRGARAHMALLDLQSQKTRDQSVWKAEAAGYRRVTVSADARFAALSNAGLSNFTVQLLRLNGRNVEKVRTWKFAYPTAHEFALSPTGDRLWLNARVVDPATGIELLRLDRRGISSSSWSFNRASWLNHTQVVEAVIIKAERGQPGSEEQLILWDATTGQRLRTVTQPSQILALAVAPDGKTFAEAGRDRMVRLRDAATLEVKEEFRAHDDAITALAFHPSRPILATGSTDLTIKLWDLDTGRQLDEFRGHTAAVKDLAFSPSGRRLASLSGIDRTTRIWEPESLNPDAAKAKADGWEDLLAKLKRDAVAKTGNGWQLNNGALFSPNKKYATVALPGRFAQCSYQVRVKLRQLTPRNGFYVFLPVADHQVGFVLDGSPDQGCATGLSRVDGKLSKDAEGAVKGRQIKDSEQHELQLTMQADGGNVRFEARLDDQPIYQWSGLASRLLLGTVWKNIPVGSLALGSQSADWVVYAVKVKRLEGKP